MSIWDWIREFRKEAAARDDAERLRLLALYDAGQAARKTDPTKTLDLLREARALAERLGERWWALHLDHWRLQALLNDFLAMNEALELAVGATLEARKPEYAQLPQRVCLHEDLVSTYVGIDPMGHADAIRQALDFMRGQVGEDVDCRFCVQNCATEFNLQCGRLDEAQGSAQLTLEMADKDRLMGEHHAVYAHCDLCEIAYRRGDWDALREESAVGEELARRKDNPRKLCEFMVWQALSARRDGEEEKAQRLLRQAIARMARSRALPSSAYFDALCAYYEHGGDLRTSLRVRTRERDNLAGKGRLFQECRAWVRRCRLMGQIGLPLAGDLAAAREAAGKLRDPAPHLEELARIEAGG